MKYEQLNLIDFSQGIKAKEVLHNDRALQEQIERERLAIAGYGIGYGLELKIQDNFQLQVLDGTIVDKEGIEKHIAGKVIEISKPNLIMRKQKVFSTEEGRIELDDIPYSITRLRPSEYTDSSSWGIELYYEDNPSVDLEVSSIKNNVIYTNARNSKRSILINYNVAYDRIDTVYINTDFEISVKQGIDSTTPSAYIPDDCKYILGFIKVNNSHYDEKLSAKTAKAFIIKEFNNRRTVYTDSSNNLYLCGIPFESLLRIYFEEPKSPKEGMLWYDMTTNKLKIWRRTDNFMFTDIYTFSSSDPKAPQLFNTSVGYKSSQLRVFIEGKNDTDIFWTELTNEKIEYYTDLKDEEKGEKESKQFRVVPKLVKGTKVKYVVNRYDDSYYWVPINDTSYISVLESKMWSANKEENNLVEFLPGLDISEMKADRKNHDLKHFIFKADELHLRFTPHKNELSVMVDQIPLHRDQFVELTVEDIMNDPALAEMAIKEYGYTTKLLQGLKDNYKEVGLGFKFATSLDRPSFIEVNIQHRVNDSILKNKLQRAATFAKTETVLYSEELKKSIKNNILTINTCVPYCFNEEQLEVFIDGRRLKKELVKEITNQDEILGGNCNKFSINIVDTNIVDGSEITYKITTTIYSYDHIVSALKEVQEPLLDKIKELEKLVDRLCKDVAILKGA